MLCALLLLAAAGTAHAQGPAHPNCMPYVPEPAALREALDAQTSALRVVDLRIAQLMAESGVR